MCSFSAKATVVQVLPRPLSFNPTPPPLNFEDETLVDVENREGAGKAPTDIGRFGVGIITLLDRDDDDESSGSPRVTHLGIRFAGKNIYLGMKISYTNQTK